MITIIYSTHKDKNYNESFKNHLISNVGLKNVQILEYQNNNEHSLSQIYNSGITESIFDIVVCCHNDIKLEKNWGKKLLQDFSNNPEFGIIGKAGSSYFPETGIYWERFSQTMVGHVYHHPENQKKWLNKYSAKFSTLVPVVTIDGLFMAFNKTKIKHKFDETLGRFHFYDHSFCLPNFLEDVKIGVTFSFDITHNSLGVPNDEFYQTKDKFIEKFKNNLPLDLKPKEIYVPEIKQKKFKKFNKVAIVIPNKNNFLILKDCVDSFFRFCDTEIFDVFIADTGSTDEEKQKIKNYIQEKINIKLIEYDYYNFSKINNHVVKNFLNDSHEHILFCNNDIKILNDVITGMLSVFEKNGQVGTVGARLHYEDNTVQHDGIFMGVHKKNNSLGVGHHNIRSYYNYSLNTKESFGNTAALLMIRKNVFVNCGMFNENYISCFEDVELNAKVLISGFKNYTCSNCVAYHYESKTRDLENTKLEKLHKDYKNNLVPFAIKNFEKIKDRLVPLE